MKNRKHNGMVLFIFLILIVVAFVVSNITIDTSTEVISVGSNSTYDGIKINLFGIEIPKLGKESGEVNTEMVGDYYIKYIPVSETKCYEKIVRVVDIQSPEIILNGSAEITVEDINEYIEPGYVAIDNYDGDITEKVRTDRVKHRNNYYEIEYSVEDSSHNTVIQKRKVHINRGTVYLTFDDGPSLDITPKILDILHQKNVTATFFVIGYDQTKEDLIKREYEEGHTIGLHGYSHDYANVYTSIDTLMENFKIVEELVEKSTGGYTSKIIRFPGGASNTVSKNYCDGIMTKAVERVKTEGYTYFDWNVDSSDAGNAKNAEEVYKNVIEGIQPRRNNVILMHDFSGNTKTLEALERIIDYCIQNNYELKSITSNTEPVQHNVAN